MGRSQAGGLGSPDHGRSGIKARNQIFILEGPDGSGKSTLANWIGGHYLHATYRFRYNMVAYHLALLKKAIELSQTSHVVIDRWRMSEIAYGSVFRDGPQRPDLTPWMMDLTSSQHVVTICCLPRHKQQYLTDYHSRLLDERQEKYEKMRRANKNMSSIVSRMGEVYDAYTNMLRFPYPMLRYDRFTEGKEDAMSTVNLLKRTFLEYHAGDVEPITCERKRR